MPMHIKCILQTNNISLAKLACFLESVIVIYFLRNLTFRNNYKPDIQVSVKMRGTLLFAYKKWRISAGLQQFCAPKFRLFEK